MEIIEELYYGNVSEIYRPNCEKYKKAREKELEIYNKFVEMLNNDQSKLLEEFIDALDESYEIEVCEKYKQGFKTGLLIGIESKDIKL